MHRIPFILYRRPIITAFAIYIYEEGSTATCIGTESDFCDSVYHNFEPQNYDTHCRKNRFQYLHVAVLPSSYM